MIQVLSKLHVSVSSCSDVKVALHLVAVQTSKNPAAVRRAPNPWCLCKLLLLLLPQMLVHVLLILPLLADALVQLMHTPLGVLARPLRPAGRILAQQIACESAIAGRVLHVDVQIGAAHGDDNVEIDLHVVRNALLHGECLCCRAGEPARGFGPGEPDACEDERYGPRGGVATLNKVCLFGFGYSCQFHVQSCKERHVRNASKLLTMFPFEDPNASSSRPWS